MPAEGPRSPFAEVTLVALPAEHVTSPFARRLRSGYRALAQGDEQPLASLLEADVQWRGLPNGLLRRRARCSGRDEVVHALRTMVADGELEDPDRWTLNDVLRVGQLAAVTFSWVTAAATTVHLAHVVRLGTGRVIAVRGYADRFS